MLRLMEIRVKDVIHLSPKACDPSNDKGGVSGWQKKRELWT